MGNKLLILIYFIIDSLIIVSCEGDKKDTLHLDSIDVKAQAPFVMTYQESLTGVTLNIPFHYTLQQRMDGDISTYSIYSYFSPEMIGSLSIYQGAQFSGADKVVVESNSSGNIKYQDNNHKVYQVGNSRENLHLTYHKYIQESDVYIIYNSNRDREIPKSTGHVSKESQRQLNLNNPIINDLRLVKGLTLNRDNARDFVAPWVKYKKELAPEDAELFASTILKIQEEVIDLDVDNSKKIVIDKLFPAVMTVAVDDNDDALRIFTEDLANNELWNYLKRVDKEAIANYESHYEADTVYKDDKNVIVSFEGKNKYPQHIYLSVSKLSIGSRTILMSIPCTTQPMAYFYLSYFNHIQEVISAPGNS